MLPCLGKRGDQCILYVGVTEWGTLWPVASPEVRGETDFLLVLIPSLPPFFFFLNSLSLLSRLPNISFDVYCWDFKRTLSTWAGVGFSEQARESRILGKRNESHQVPTLGAGVPSPRPCVSPGGVWECAGFSPLLFKACLRGSVFLQSD